MAERSIVDRLLGRNKEQVVASRVPTNQTFKAVAGIPDIVRDTERLGKDSNYDNEFDMYDLMLKLDPELNGAVRAVSLTANNFNIDYNKGKNAAIRNAVRDLVEETLDFDDILINSMRNLMVYGNDINKIVAKSGVGVTELQNLPIMQISIVDERGGLGSYFVADKDNPVVKPVTYMLREATSYEKAIPVSEILHVKIDYRSNWFTDMKGRKTYGIWGASRFSALKQAIRMKYNSLNNRVSLEDSMTKQYITIDQSAIEHIQDPAEQYDRLNTIMTDVISLFEGLRGDQIPVLPHYVNLHHVDLENSLPNSSDFLDSINADIAAVLQVPRVAAGQERGSTFAATYNANLWAVQAIGRMHKILQQAFRDLFSMHLTLLGITHKKSELPEVIFDTMDSETPLTVMQRATMGYDSGVLTLNQALNILELPKAKKDEGEERKTTMQNKQDEENATRNDLPRENTQPGAENIRPE
tara:strand:- start:226 stop:1635 length:1410 start_codon:yes stop_codon:yes gene_type:complete